MSAERGDRGWAAGKAVNPGMQAREAAANGARAAMTIDTESVFARAEQAPTVRSAVKGA